MGVAEGGPGSGTGFVDPRIAQDHRLELGGEGGLGASLLGSGSGTGGGSGSGTGIRRTEEIEGGGDGQEREGRERRHPYSYASEVSGTESGSGGGGGDGGVSRRRWTVHPLKRIAEMGRLRR